MTDLIIETHQVTKRFGRGAACVVALDGLDLLAPAGRVTAVLGPNGAGKTTFVRAVATLHAVDSGTLRVAGIDATADPRAGPVSYADFLIPGLAAGAVFFAGTGAAVGVAEDVDNGLYDRLRSLPVPRSAILLGRSIADTALVTWSIAVTVAVGLLTGYRFHGSPADAAFAVALCVVYGAAFTWPFIYLGLVAGNAPAANAMSFLAFPLIFVSSAYVPVDSMPGWMQPFAENQPLTLMIDSVRALSVGDDAAAILPHPAGWYAGRALAWAAVITAVFAPPGHPPLRPPVTGSPPNRGHDPVIRDSLAALVRDGREW